MVNTKRKGDRTTKKGKELLEKKGYLVYIPPWNRFGQKDIFNCWDAIAVDKNGEGTVKFIQFRTNSKHDISKQKKFPKGKYSKEIWVWKDKDRSFHITIL